MDQRTLNFLLAIVYIIAGFALCRLVGASVAHKRFSIRDGIYGTTLIAIMAAILAVWKMSR